MSFWNKATKLVKSVVGSVPIIGAPILAHEQRKAMKQASAQQAAAEAAQIQASKEAAAREDAAAVQNSAVAALQNSDLNEMFDAQSAETLKKRRYSFGNTINNSSLMGALTGKYFIGG